MLFTLLDASLLHELCVYDRWTQLLGFADTVTVGQVQDENLIFQWFSELNKCIYEETHAVRNNIIACDMEPSLLSQFKHYKPRNELWLCTVQWGGSCFFWKSWMTTVVQFTWAVGWSHTWEKSFKEDPAGTYGPAVLLEGSVYNPRIHEFQKAWLHLTIYCPFFSTLCFMLSWL